MKNLAGVSSADETILEELYLAGIPKSNKCSTGEVPYTFVGKLGKWTFTRLWYYWSARVEKDDTGLPLKIALELHNRKHPTKDNSILGDEIRAGGHAGGISPDDYVSGPIYNDELNSKLEALGYKKEYSDLFKKEYIPINRGEIATLCNEGKLIVERFVDCYHIDTQIGLNEFVKTVTSDMYNNFNIPTPTMPTEKELKSYADSWWGEHIGINFNDWNDTLRSNSFDFRICKLDPILK